MDCMKCNNYMSISKCCKAELSITKNGRVKCTSCNKFCKMEDCKEKHTRPLVEYEEEDHHGYYTEPIIDERKTIIAMLILIATIVVMLYMNLHK